MRYIRKLPAAARAGCLAAGAAAGPAEDATKYILTDYRAEVGGHQHVADVITSSGSR